jgi:ABC-type sugar transport system permease subunit
LLAAYIALMLAGVFTGAALYINFAEQPARFALDDRALLVEWKLAYQRGYAMQATLVLVGFLLGMWAWRLTNKTVFFVAALVFFANWPWTLFVMLPVNKRLQATPRDNADAETRALLRKWNYLHGVRTLLGFVSALGFLWGIATK